MSSGSVLAGLPEPLTLGRRRRFVVLVLLGALTAMAPLSIDMYLPGLPAIASDLAVDAAAVQLSLTACLLGIAVGQLLAGTASDSLGRRPLILGGMTLFAVASAGCALAGSIELFIALRFVQGLSGAAAIVVGRAVVADLYRGSAVARIFSLLILVTGTAPILAPLLGGQILLLGSWRLVFWVLVAIGLLLVSISAVLLPETLAASSRRVFGVGSTGAAFGTLARDRVYAGYVIGSGCVLATMFAYISGSPFVIQEQFGGSPQLFSLLFATNSLALVISAQVNGRLVSRVPLRRLLTMGLSILAVGAAAVLLVGLTGGPLLALSAALVVCLAGIGVVSPNATALALGRHPRMAGTAASALGGTQYVIGAAVAPLVGLGGAVTAISMGSVMLALALLAITAIALLTRPPALPATAAGTRGQGVPGDG